MILERVVFESSEMSLAFRRVLSVTNSPSSISSIALELRKNHILLDTLRDLAFTLV